MSAALLIAAAIAGGTLFTWRLHPRWSLPVRLAVGLPLGLVVQGLAGLGGASLLAGGALPGAVIGTSAPVLLLALPSFRRDVAHGLARAWSGVTSPAAWRRARCLDVLAWLIGSLALLAVFERALLVGPEGLGTGVEHNFGDLPFHLSVAAGFAWGENIPPEHPELAGVRLTYPYLVDFLAALWVRAGLELTQAFRLQHALLVPALVLLLGHWGCAATRDRCAARLVPLLVLLSGGLGFAWAVADLRASPDGLAAFLMHLPRDYTIQPGGPLRWGNAVLTLLVPQRGWLLALPLLLVVWSLWAEALQVAGGIEDGEAAPRHVLLFGSGVVAGLLPFVHGHSYATVMALGAALALLFPPPRTWAMFFIPALALGAPQVWALAQGSSLRAGTFVGLHVGWDRGAWNPLLFWLLNLGAFLPLAACALARAPARLRRFHAPFALLFVVPNLLRLSPWIWDNVKFLFPWFVSAAPLVAAWVARLAEGRAGRRAAATALVIVLTLAGALDLWRVASRQVALRLFDADGLAFARRVREVTPPRTRLLHWPTHDAPTLLSGRPTVLGYPGHIWSQGLDAGTREADIAAFYTGAPEGDDVLRRYHVDFVVLGPLEHQHAGAGAAALARFPLVASVGRYRLHDVRARR